MSDAGQRTARRPSLDAASRATARARRTLERGAGRLVLGVTRPRRSGDGGDRADVRAAVVLDAWVERSLAPEWEQLPVLPRTWPQVLRSRPHLLLVQASATRSGAWAPRPDEPAGGPSRQLRDLLAGADEAGVPTVLWVTDPEAWEHELATARLFRTVLTVDPAAVDLLREDLRHDRVHVLPHAAQPRWENPAVRPQPAERRSVVVGVDLAEQVEGPDDWLAGLAGLRKQYRPQLVSVVMRGHEATTDVAVQTDAPAPVPERLHGLRHAAVPVPSLVPVLRGHELVCARGVPAMPDLDLRVAVAASAAGVAVGVPPREAVDAQYAGRLTLVPTGEAGADAVRALLDNPELRDRVAHRAMRHVLAHHTWAHRVDLLRRLHGLSVPSRATPVSVLVATSRAHHLARIVRLMGAQTHPELELVVLDRGSDVDEADLKARARRAGLGDPLLLRGRAGDSRAGLLRRAAGAAGGRLVAVVEERGHYAPHYLQDLVAAQQRAGEAVLGKRAHYVHVLQPGVTLLRHPGQEHVDVPGLDPATLLLARDLLTDLLRLPGAGRRTGTGGAGAEVLAAADVAACRLHATDRFNYLRNRTVTGARPELLPDAVVQFYGPGETHVDV